MNGMNEATAVINGIMRWLQREENASLLEDGLAAYRNHEGDGGTWLVRLDCWMDKVADAMDAAAWLKHSFGTWSGNRADWQFAGDGALFDWYDVVLYALAKLDGVQHLVA
jgi:hypothetical protein